MSTIAFTTPDAAKIRFGLSALWEVMASVRVLREPDNHVVHLPWVRRVGAEVESLTVTAGSTHRAAFALLGELVGSGVHRHYLPDWLTPAPTSLSASIDDDLHRLLQTPAEEVRSQVAHLTGRWSPALQAIHDDPAAHLPALADAIARYWVVCLAPYWARITAISEAEVYERGQQLAGHGTAAVLNDLHDRVHWDGTELTVSGTRCLGAQALDGGGLRLVPSIFIWPAVLVVTDSRTAQLSYPARGSARVWAGGFPARLALEGVLGRSKARLIAALDAPRSTTAAAEAVGLSVSAASEHLSALRAAGLVTTRRSGRSQLNSRTSLGEALLAGAG